MASESSDNIFVLGVVRGLGEGDGWKYFGSLLAIEQWEAAAVESGVIVPDDSDENGYVLTDAGRALCETLRGATLLAGRAYLWPPEQLVDALAHLEEIQAVHQEANRGE